MVDMLVGDNHAGQALLWETGLGEPADWRARCVHQGHLGAVVHGERRVIAVEARQGRSGPQIDDREQGSASEGVIIEELVAEKVEVVFFDVGGTLIHPYPSFTARMAH